MDNSFERFIDDTLIDGLSSAMKGAVSRLLARGIEKEKILAVVRSKAPRNSTLYFAVEVFIERINEAKRKDSIES